MNYIHQLLLYVILIAILVQNVAAKKKVKVCLFQHLRYKFHQDYVNNNSIFIIQPDKVTIDFEIQLLKELGSNVWFQIGIYKCVKTFKKCQSLFAYDLEACTLLGNSKDRYNILSFWMQGAMKHCNLPTSCPVAKGTYYWHNLKPLKDGRSPFMSIGLYRTDVLIYKRKFKSNETIADICVSSEVKMK